MRGVVSDNGLTRTTSLTDAGSFYFEDAGSGYKYMYVLDSSSSRRYVTFDQSNGHVGLLNSGELATSNCKFELVLENGFVYIKWGNYRLNKFSGYGGMIYSGWNDKDDGSKMFIVKREARAGDWLGIQGQNLIIINKQQNKALMASTVNNGLGYTSVKPASERVNNLDTYEDEDSSDEASLWVFTSTNEGVYYISTSTSEGTKYLSCIGTNIVLSDIPYGFTVDNSESDSITIFTQSDRYRLEYNNRFFFANGSRNANTRMTLGLLVGGHVIYKYVPNDSTKEDTLTGSDEMLEFEAGMTARVPVQSSYYEFADTNKTYGYKYDFAGWSDGTNIYQPAEELPDPGNNFLTLNSTWIKDDTIWNLYHITSYVYSDTGDITYIPSGEAWSIEITASDVANLNGAVVYDEYSNRIALFEVNNGVISVTIDNVNRNYILCPTYSVATGEYKNNQPTNIEENLFMVAVNGNWKQIVRSYYMQPVYVKNTNNNNYRQEYYNAYLQEMYTKYYNTNYNSANNTAYEFGHNAQNTNNTYNQQSSNRKTKFFEVNNNKPPRYIFYTPFMPNSPGGSETERSWSITNNNLISESFYTITLSDALKLQYVEAELTRPGLISGLDTVGLFALSSINTNDFTSYTVSSPNVIGFNKRALTVTVQVPASLMRTDKPGKTIKKLQLVGVTDPRVIYDGSYQYDSTTGFGTYTFIIPENVLTQPFEVIVADFDQSMVTYHYTIAENTDDVGTLTQPQTMPVDKTVEWEDGYLSEEPDISLKTKEAVSTWQYISENLEYRWTYQFECWKDTEGNEYQLGDPIDLDPGDSLILKPRWQLLSKVDRPYTVIYDLNLPVGKTFIVEPEIVGNLTSNQEEASGNWMTHYQVRNLTSEFYQTTEWTVQGTYESIKQFVGWQTESGTIIKPGDEINLSNSEFDAEIPDKVVNLKAIWSNQYDDNNGQTDYNNKTYRDVRFFISTKATSADIFNENAEISITAADFTPFLFRTIMNSDYGNNDNQTVAPKRDKLNNNTWKNLISYDPYPKDGSSIDQAGSPYTDTSITSANDKIRQLGTSTGYNSDLPYGTTANFRLLSFPTDEEIIAKIRTQYASTVTLDGKLIEPENLTTDNFTVRWYVCKSHGDGWHIDGKLTPKVNFVTITKTFAGDNTALANIPQNYGTISDDAGIYTGTGGYYITLTNTADEENVYTLILQPGNRNNHNRNSINEANNKIVYGYADYDESTKTYTWSVPTAKLDKFNILEHNYDIVVDGVEYGISAQYSLTNPTGDIDEIPLTTWFSTVDGHSASYPVDLADISTMQRTNLFNTYVETDKFIIQKRDMGTGSAIMPGVQFRVYQVNANGGKSPVKVSKKDGSNADNGEYNVLYDNGSVSDVAITGSDGNIYLRLPQPLTDGKANTFYIEEIVPEGYKKAANPPGFTVQVYKGSRFVVPEELFVTEEGYNSIELVMRGRPGMASEVPAGVTVMNEPIRILEVDVTKEWEDCNPEQSITVKLTGTANGIEWIEREAVITAGENNIEKNWKQIWNGLPLVVGNFPVHYTVEETMINTYPAGSDAFKHWIPQYLIPVYKDENNEVLRNNGSEVDSRDVYKVRYISLTVRNSVQVTNVVTVKMNKVSSGEKITSGNSEIDKPLYDAEFQIYQEVDPNTYEGSTETISFNGSPVTVKNNGFITTIPGMDLKFIHNRTYYLKETKSPTGYSRRDGFVKIQVDETGHIYDDSGTDIGCILENNSKMSGYVELTPETNNPLINTLTIWNIPTALQLKAISAVAPHDEIQNAHFALYRADGEIRDRFPMEGFENLVSDEHGIIRIAESDNDVITYKDIAATDLKDGIYHLVETQIVEGYSILLDPIVITVTGTEIQATLNGVHLENVVTTPEIPVENQRVTKEKYLIDIPHQPNKGICKLTHNGELLYYEVSNGDVVSYEPAVYGSVKAGFDDAVSGITLYKKTVEGGYVELNTEDRYGTSDTPIKLEMLKAEANVPDPINIGDNPEIPVYITLTTAGSTDTYFPYRGASGTASRLIRTISGDNEKTQSMITTGITGFTLENITLDGGYNYAADIGRKDAINGSILKVESGIVTLSTGSTLQNAYASGDGGAVYNAGTLVMQGNAVIQECESDGRGGGVYVADGKSLTIHDTAVIQDCYAAISGGAVATGNGTTITFSSTATFSENMTAGSGGVISLDGSSTLIMSTGTMTGNQATSGSAIAANSTDSIVHISGGTIIGNKVNGSNSGAVYLASNEGASAEAYFSGTVLIKDNTGNGDCSNLYTEGDVTAIWTEGEGLSNAADIGVCSVNHNQAGDQFGKVSGTATQNLDRFYNDTYGFRAKLRNTDEIVWGENLLTVVKIVIGADKEKTFIIQVMATNPALVAGKTYPVSGIIGVTSLTVDASGVLEFQIKDGDRVIINDLPYATYTVTETEAVGETGNIEDQYIVTNAVNNDPEKTGSSATFTLNESSSTHSVAIRNVEKTVPVKYVLRKTNGTYQVIDPAEVYNISSTWNAVVFNSLDQAIDITDSLKASGALFSNSEQVYFTGQYFFGDAPVSETISTVRSYGDVYTLNDNPKNPDTINTSAQLTLTSDGVDYEVKGTSDVSWQTIRDNEQQGCVYVVLDTMPTINMQGRIISYGLEISNYSSAQSYQASTTVGYPFKTEYTKLPKVGYQKTYQAWTGSNMTAYRQNYQNDTNVMLSDVAFPYVKAKLGDINTSEDISYVHLGWNSTKHAYEWMAYYNETDPAQQTGISVGSKTVYLYYWWNQPYNVYTATFEKNDKGEYTNSMTNRTSHDNNQNDKSVLIPPDVIKQLTSSQDDSITNKLLKNNVMPSIVIGDITYDFYKFALYGSDGWNNDYNNKTILSDPEYFRRKFPHF